MPFGVDDEISVGQASPDDNRQEDKADGAHECLHRPVARIGDEPWQKHLLRGRRPSRAGRGLTLRKEPNHQQKRYLGKSGDSTRHHQLPKLLACEPSRKKYRNQSVGADDVAGEDNAMDEPEQKHPPAPTPHQAARIDGRTLARPGLLLRCGLTS